MSQQISTFGQHPAANAQPGAEPSPTSGNRRTVVLAVTGAVVALGMLGGAAALALSPGDDGTDLTAPLPAATASAEPSVEPSVEPTAPLPTAAVQGRNIFVPLLGAATDPGGEATGSGSADAGSGTMQMEATPAPAGPSTEVLQLRSTVAQLTAQLVALQDVLDAPDTLTGAETALLNEQLATTSSQLAAAETALADIAAKEFSSVVVSVDDPAQDDSAADFSVIVTDGEEPVVSEDVAIGGTTVDGRFTYVGYDAETSEVTFRYVSSLVTVRVGITIPAP